MENKLHLGFIVDGNRRWAKERGLPTIEGHRRGYRKVEDAIEYLAAKKVKYMTFYLFSTENWNRSKEEVSYLMDLVRKNLARLTKKLMKLDLKLAVLGRPEPVDPKLWQSLMDSEKLTKNNKSGTVSVCFNYGGQQELADAATALIADGHKGEVTVEDLNNHIYHPEVPPVDMIIRTSGEQRLSGFMLWRAAYSELFFLNKNFPSITSSDLDDIIDEYNHRNRRYGK